MSKSTHKAIRVYITERCNANCPNCFNANNRMNKEMSLSDFTDLCKYLKKNGYDHLKIMGGEPTLHKEFPEVIRIAQEYFMTISIFTNGLLDSVKKIKLREHDSIIYNFNFNKALTIEKMFFPIGGTRAFEIQVTPKTNEETLVTRILELTKNVDVRISLTLDCTANIFHEKASVVPKLRYIEDKLLENNKSFSYDHKIPLCYLYKTGLHISNNHKCTTKDAGLIGADLSFRFCNQHSKILINLKNENEFLPWAIVDNYIKKSFYEIQSKALEQYCINCVFYDSKCNGGCWIPKDSITKADIINNTSFPVKKN